MRPVVVVALSAVLATACTDDDPGVVYDDTYNCATETRADELVVGFERAGSGGAIRYRLLSWTPAPATHGDNTWVIELTAMGDGAPVSGAPVTLVPWMPDHMHTSPYPIQITPLATPGQYELKFNMWMAGLWENTINVGGATADSAVFRACIAS